MPLPVRVPRTARRGRTRADALVGGRLRRPRALLHRHLPLRPLSAGVRGHRARTPAGGAAPAAPEPGAPTRASAMIPPVAENSGQRTSSERMDLGERSLRQHTARGTLVNGAFLVGLYTLSLLRG